MWEHPAGVRGLGYPAVASLFRSTAGINAAYPTRESLSQVPVTGLSALWAAMLLPLIPWFAVVVDAALSTTARSIKKFLQTPATPMRTLFPFDHRLLCIPKMLKRPRDKARAGYRTFRTALAAFLRLAVGGAMLATTKSRKARTLAGGRWREG